MLYFYQLLTALALALTFSCDALENSEETLAQLEEDLTSAEETYNALNLSCDINSILGIDTAEDATAYSLQNEASDHNDDHYDLEDSDCSGTELEEYYMVLEDAYDSDDDGALSDTEIASAIEEFSQKQTDILDTDGDGSISDSEKTSYKNEKLAAIKEKRAKRFEKICSERNEDQEDCRKGRSEMVTKLKADIKTNFSTKTPTLYIHYDS